MSKSFVQVPPQSTGKRILTELRKEIYYDNGVGIFFNGDVVVGANSQATGIVTAVVTEGFNQGEGELYLKEFAGEFQNNEPLQVNSEIIAYAKIEPDFSQSEYDIQKVIISDPNNPENSQKIDRFGATVNTFTDGSPVFGPFGTLSIGEPQTIKFYRFAMDNDEGSWQTEVVGNAENTWNPEKTTTRLFTGTNAGDKVIRTTHYYHPYVPGIGRNVEFTTQLGDNGKNGLRRRIGYFDEKDGVFFEQEDGILYVVLRSSVTGSVVDTRIPQTQWNLDKADGSDNIGFTLDLTKANMYWIDLQWHGAGRVRFGTYEPEGSRIPLHVFKLANETDVYPYMRTASLPMRIEQENTGSVISGSEMYTTSLVVRHTSEAVITGDQYSELSEVRNISDVDGEVPILAVRHQQLFNGVTNRGIFKWISSDLVNLGLTPVVWRIRYDQSGQELTGGSFNNIQQGSFMQSNNTSEGVSNPQNVKTLIQSVTLGTTKELLKNNDDRKLHTFEATMLADGVTQPNLILTAEVIGVGSTSITATLNWEEYRL